MQSNRIFFASLSVKCGSVCVTEFCPNAATYMYLRNTEASSNFSPHSSFVKTSISTSWQDKLRLICSLYLLLGHTQRAWVACGPQVCRGIYPQRVTGVARLRHKRYIRSRDVFRPNARKRKYLMYYLTIIIWLQ